MLDTILVKRGGCALGRVCKRESQTLARGSDLRAVQAQPGSPAIMPGCLCVYVCVHARVCVRVCVCARVRVYVLAHTYQLSAIRPLYYPTRHQVGVRQRLTAEYEFVHPGSREEKDAIYACGTRVICSRSPKILAGICVP